MEVQVTILQAKDGTDILEVNKDGKSYRLNSAYRPMDEAKKFAKKYTDISEHTVLAVFGFGNGIIPRAIARQASEYGATVIFYEPGREIYDCIKNHFDYDGFGAEFGYGMCLPVEESGVHVYAPEHFPLLLEQRIRYKKNLTIEFVILPKYAEMFPEEYQHFRKELEHRLNEVAMNTNTSIALGMKIVENNIKNIRYIADGYCGEDFVHLFPEDLPAIIVSAGPSLDKNIHLLKDVKGKAFLLCVDTAVRNLLKRDIIPDMIISIDPRKALDLFEDTRIKDVPIVGIPDMSTNVLDKVSAKRVIFASTENDYIIKIYRKAGYDMPHLSSGSSVATMAFSICKHWGFRVIMLVGQDLAMTGSQFYADGGKIDISKIKSPVKEIEDIYGNPVYTTPDYYSYLCWFEQRIAMSKEITTIDATEGGAKIRGTKIMTLADALEQYGAKDVDVKGIIESVKPAFNEQQKKEVFEEVHTSRNALKFLQMELQRGMGLAQKGIKMAKRNEDNLAQYLRINEQMGEICDHYVAMEECFMIQRVIDAQSLSEFMDLMDETGRNVPELCKTYVNMEHYFKMINNAAEPVKKLFDALELC